MKAILDQIQAYIDDHEEYDWYEAPSDIMEMEEIQLLDVKAITSFAPLGEFKNLKSLIFGTTDCTMTIKDLAGIEEVQALESLTFMCKTKIKNGVELISKLSNMRSLGLYNVVQELPGDLVAGLHKLEQLSLSKQNYDSITKLPPNLLDLSVNIDAIEALPAWNKVETMRALSLGSNTCQLESLDSFSCFPNLEIIKLNAPKQLTDISYVKQLDNLKSIEVNFSGIDTLSDFSGNSMIEEIKARGTAVIDLKNIEPLQGLKKLYLEKSKLQNIEGINSILPNVELLWIWDTKLKDLSPLTGMTSLKELDVTMLKPKSWEFLSSLTGLETLDLCKTSFSDIELLMNLPQLKSIRLSGSKVDPKTDGFKAFRKMIESRNGQIR